jgi:hypothetical protein
MVPCDFIDLTEGEAFPICELVGCLYLTGDTRMTITERLVEAVEEQIADPSVSLLD